MKQRLLATALGLLSLALCTWWLSSDSLAPTAATVRSSAQNVSPTPARDSANAPKESAAAVPKIRRPTPAVFGQNGPVVLSDVPAGRFAEDLANLPAPARSRALEQLGKLRPPLADAGSLHVDATGQLFYACGFGLTRDAGNATDSPANLAAAADGRVDPSLRGPTLAEFSASVPIASPPIRHSKPGSTNVIYLDFNGHTVTGTAWNTAAGAPSAYACIAFDLDGNASTFSAAEQAAIVRIWERVAEDYRAFDVDVTTEEPSAAMFATNRVARALITRSSDANGVANPSSATASGVAYVGVFGSNSFNTSYSVAFVYHNGYTEGFVSSVVSHEIGHNMGLSHDGTQNTDGTKKDEYYSGHGSGATAWSPIMGSGSGKVIQWSKGEYYMANNTQDDLAIISNVLTLRPDDHADTRTTATALITNGSQVQHRGIIRNAADSDWFSFRTSGPASLSITPTTIAAFTMNLGSLDVTASLYDSNGNLLSTSAPDDSPAATLSVDSAGTFYVRVAGTGFGTPLVNPPTGYTSYASIGQFVISGTITAVPESAAPAIFEQPTNQTEFPGNSATFSLIASGNPATNYQWQRSVNSGGSWDNLVDDTTHTGTTSASLVIASVITEMNGYRYRCVVSNSAGNVTSSAVSLTVQTPPPPIQPSFGSGAPSPTFGRAIPAGTSANLNVTLLAGSDPITYQWRLNGVDIPGANGLYYFIRNWQAANAGVYTVVATNSAGSAVSQPFTQFVSPEGGWTFRNPLPTGNGTTRAAFLNGQFFVGGIRGTLLVSADGLNWTTRTIPAANNLYGFHFINNLYVILGSLGAVYSSPDAITWTPRNTGTLHQDSSSGLQSVANSGSRLMAVGIGGIFTTTTDGMNWTAGTIGTGDDLNGVTFAFGKFHAVSSTNGKIYSSVDGTNWTSVASSAPSLRCITFGAGRLVAAGSSGAITTSTDGVNWSSATSGTSNFILGVEFVNNQFIATGVSGTILTSPNGTTWTARTTGNTSQLQNAAYGNGIYVVPGQSGTSGRAILTSTDSVTWIERTVGVGAVGTTLRAVAASSTSIVAVSSTGTILQSTDGATWTQRASLGTQLNDVSFGNGVFLTVGNSSTLRSSADGVSWSTITSPATSATLNGITYSNDRWVLTGLQSSFGRIYTSINNGLSWSLVYTGNSNALNHAAYGNSIHVAVGNGGTIVRSTSGSSWSSVTSGTTLALNDVTFGNGTFVAVGAGVVLTSNDGLTWTDRSFAPDPLNSVVYAGGYFIAVGPTLNGSGSAAGSTYYVSADGVNWTGRFTGAVDSLTDTVAFNGRLYAVGDNSIILSAGTAVLATSPSITATSGTTATLVGVPSSSPVPVTYQWWRNGAPINGATTPTLALPKVQLSQAGPYTLIATNAFGVTTSNPITLTVEAAPNSFAAWQLANFTLAELQSATSTAASAVASADGLPNLLKYALGLSAKTPATGAVMSITSTETEWIVTYTRPVATDVSYAVEFSTDLANWSVDGVTHEQISASVGTATWRARLPLASAPANAFFRLRVTQ